MRHFISIFLFAISVFPQKSDGSLYARGLQACLEKEIAAYSRFSDRDLRNVTVLYDFYVTRHLPTELGDISIRYLTNSDLIQEFKKLPKDKRERGIPYIKIFFFSERRLISSHGLEGGCHAEIGFDAVENKFIITGVELSGIRLRK